MDAWQGYTLVGRVAEQRRSRVWKAHDDALGRDVAIKELVSPDPGEVPSLLEQWRNEARLLAALDHPNVVAIYELRAADAGAVIIEEWVEGATLAAVVAQHGPLDPPQAMAVARGALRGLAHAHDRGVVHGDVSLSNVIVDLEGESRLIDFGLASGGAATTGSSGGTPAFRAPEVLVGPPTAASDVYSSAAVVATLLRGEPSLVPASKGVPEPIRGVLEKALDPDPLRRYPDAGTFLAALEEAAQSRYGPVWWSKAGLGAAAGAAMSAVVVESALPAGIAANAVDAPATVISAAAKAGRGHVALLGAGALTAALLVGGGAYAVSQHSDASPTRSGSASSAKTSLAPAAAAGGSVASPTTSARPANWPGSYRTRVVLRKVTGGFFDSSSIKVGQTTGSHFTLTALCGAGPCDINAVSDKNTTLRLTYTSGTWLLKQAGTAQCGVVGQKLSKATTTYTDKLVLKSAGWSDETPPAFTGTETVVYAPCKGAKAPSTLTYSVTVTPSAP